MKKGKLFNSNSLYYVILLAFIIFVMNDSFSEQTTSAKEFSNSTIIKPLNSYFPKHILKVDEKEGLKIEITLATKQKEIYQFSPDGTGVIIHADGTEEKLSLEETAELFGYTPESFVRAPFLHMKFAVESWTDTPEKYNISAAIDGYLLDLIDQYAGNYYNSSWNLTLEQFKAWIATIAWGEGGRGGYTAHSQGGLGSDVFYHISAGSSFKFSTGIGPFQIDNGQIDNWHLWPTIQKLNPVETVKTTAKWHQINRGIGSTLKDFSNNSAWYAVQNNPSGHWTAVTGTSWSENSAGRISIDWNTIKQTLKNNASGYSYLSINKNIIDMGNIQWNIKSSANIFTDSGLPIVFDSTYNTCKIVARDWAGNELYKYYYTGKGSGTSAIEVWVYDNGGMTNEFKYIFARQCNGQWPEKRNGYYAGYPTLSEPAIFLTSRYTLSVNSSGVSSVSISSSTGHSGTTNYTAKLESGTSVSLTAPATVGDYAFQN
ncbi:MAG TPA: hypothetical protein PLX23_08785, partial [Candidatus Hydrogenedens sp.]|nr:hypothetical protein [Candidatus Hydrogenedens sp.]